MKNVLASAMEAELGALFFKCQQETALIITLEKMGHQQLPTPLVKDRATRNGFVNDNIQQQKSREIDMVFYWVCNRGRQGTKIKFSSLCPFWKFVYLLQMGLMGCM